MHIDHNGPLPAGRARSRRPHIHAQTILAPSPGAGSVKEKETLRPARRIAIVLDDRGVALRTPVGVDQAVAHTTSVYDAMGRVVQATNPDGSYVTIAYDDWQTTTIDENGHKQVSQVKYCLHSNYYAG